MTTKAGRDSSQSVAETDTRGGSWLTDKAIEGKLAGEAGDGSADWGGGGEKGAVADLDSERGLSNATIAEDGYAPLIHDVGCVCWGEWEKRGDSSGLRGAQGQGAQDDRCGG